MDENEHKRAIVKHDDLMQQEYGEKASQYQVQRWRKTYRDGIFHADTMKDHRHLYVCEGPFDAIPLLLEGLTGVVAVAGTHIDVMAIPKHVFDVTLALDADMRSKKVVGEVIDRLAAEGISAVLCVPYLDGDGKDWSERYRRCGRAGLAALYEPVQPVDVPLLEQLQEDCKVTEPLTPPEVVLPDGPTHEPSTLPPLPRSVCPHICLGWNAKNEQTKQLCRNTPLPNGWCLDHQLSCSFLEVGARLGYPEVKFHNRILRAGIEYWETRASRSHADRPPLERDFALLLEQCGYDILASAGNHMDLEVV
jgi:DNA primase